MVSKIKKVGCRKPSSFSMMARHRPPLQCCASLFSEPRCRGAQFSKCAIRMQFLCPLVEHVLGLDDIRIGNAAIDRTHCRALFFLKMSHTLCTFFWNDVVEVVRDCFVRRAVLLPLNSASINCRVRTLRFTGSAVDTLLCDKSRQSDISSS